jgi:hypothetical protein
MAWEIVVTYKNFLLAKKRAQVKGRMPHMSLISSGSAAIAIQSMLKNFGLPNLKVLADNNTDYRVLDAMKKLGCEVFLTGLGRKPFSWKEILALTHNSNGFDITSNEALDPTTRFYDWMSYEILNHSPDYCFIPFGSGHLYQNIMNINKKEVQTENHDPRFYGNIKILRNCHFMGATTSNPESKAKKLAIFNKTDKSPEQWLQCYRLAGYCGRESNICSIEEKFLDEALRIAEDQHIICEPSGIAGLGLLLQMADKIPKNKKILIINTGKTKYPIKSF